MSGFANRYLYLSGKNQTCILGTYHLCSMFDSWRRKSAVRMRMSWWHCSKSEGYQFDTVHKSSGRNSTDSPQRCIGSCSARSSISSTKILRSLVLNSLSFIKNIYKTFHLYYLPRSRQSPISTGPLSSEAYFYLAFFVNKQIKFTHQDNQSHHQFVKKS